MGIIEWLHGEQPVPTLSQEQEVNRKDDEGKHDDHHDHEQNEVRTRGRSNSAQIDVGHDAYHGGYPQDIRNFRHQAMERECSIDREDQRN